MEISVAQYLTDSLLESKEKRSLRQVRVAVADSIWVAPTATVTATVQYLYRASESIELAPLLSQVVADAAQPPTFASNPILVFSVGPNDASVVIEESSGGSNYSSKEIALIVITVFLSCVLLIVSSVLLYITGGWTVCKSKLTDCLFEEVEEDEEEMIQQQPTFPIQHSEDADDEESNITSLPPTSASGILGVSRNKHLPPPALDSLHSSNDADSSAMYGDGMTPVSNPLGIASMRKLPNVGGGFGGMVRMARSARQPNK